MKSTIIIFIILFSGLMSNAQSDSKKEAEYILKGKLITEFDRFTPLCGVLAWATVVEFEIVEFTDKSFLGKKIPVIFTCPNSHHRDLFKVGKTYELILNTDKFDSSKWTFLEGKKEILSKSDLKKEYLFVETKGSRKNKKSW